MRGGRRGGLVLIAVVVAVMVADPLAAQDAAPMDHGPIRGFVYAGVQFDASPGSFDRAAGVGGVWRVAERWFLGGRIQGEDREGGGADFLMMLDGGRFVRGRMWGGAHLDAVGGAALRNGDWFWTAGLRAGGKDSFNPFNIEVEVRVAGGQGDIEVWSAFFIGFTFPPFSLDGRP